jgi:hypothetical protein
MSAVSSEPAHRARAERRIDIAATVLLALATLATAWAGYQSSRWHSEQAKAQAKATASRIEAARSAGVANRQVQVDIALFTEWVDARARDEAELAEFYRARFTDRLRPAFQAWIATDPFDDVDAPSSPFTMDAYELQSNKDADALEATATSAAAEAAEAIDSADRYVLAVVLFAACLALAGLSTRLGLLGARAAILTLGCLVFAGTVIWVATFPVTVTT